MNHQEFHNVRFRAPRQEHCSLVGGLNRADARCDCCAGKSAASGGGPLMAQAISRSIPRHRHRRQASACSRRSQRSREIASRTGSRSSVDGPRLWQCSRSMLEIAKPMAVPLLWLRLLSCSASFASGLAS